MSDLQIQGKLWLGDTFNSADEVKDLYIGETNIYHSPEHWNDDGKIHGFLTIPSDGTYRIYYTSGATNAGNFTTVTVDGNTVNSRDISLTAGNHEVIYTPRDNKLGIIFRETNNYWTKIYIPNTITIINSYAFFGVGSNASKPVKLIIDKSKIISIEANSFRNSKLNFGNIDFPNLTQCGNYPFYNYNLFKKIKNLGTISALSDYFAVESKIRYFNIPATVTSVGVQAFRIDSYNIVYIFNSIVPPSYGSSAIYRTPKAIYVPATSVNAYKTATGWSAWANQIQAIPE